MMARQNTPISETLALEEILVEESTYLKRKCSECDIDEVLTYLALLACCSASVVDV
jgi:hypothetical protein